MNALLDEANALLDEEAAPVREITGLRAARAARHELPDEEFPAPRLSTEPEASAADDVVAVGFSALLRASLRQWQQAEAARREREDAERARLTRLPDQPDLDLDELVRFALD